MSCLEINNLDRPKRRAGNVVLAVFAVMIFAVLMCTAQVMQKGISVELATTTSAVAVPEADKQDALIVTVTGTGGLYFGIEPVTPDTLAAKLKGRVSQGTKSLYIKADARAPYAYVVKILDAARIAGVVAITLLTTQPKATQAGTVVPPEGIEMELERRAPEAMK
jgi:biopolymer transport protein ExbD